MDNTFTRFNEDSSLYFNTELKPLYAYDSYDQIVQAGKFQGVVRTDTNDCLGVFKEDSYTLVKNTDFFTGIEDQLIDYFDPIVVDSIEVNDHISHNGASSIREYRFPTISKSIESDRHKTSLTFRVIGWNCFDGSSRCRIVVGNVDMFCTNGMITGDYDASSKKRTSGFSLMNFLNNVTTGIKRFEDDVLRYQSYAETKVLTPYVHSFFENLSGVSERNVKRLQEQYQEEMSIRGNNLWAVVSTLTNYASHTDGRFPTRNTGNNHDGVTSFNRQTQVNKWLNSDAMRHLQRNSVMV